MREFQDEQGRAWTATVEERPGIDYKGRYHLVMRSGDEVVQLEEIRWNDVPTAERTLATMSLVELHRRLRSALGRAGHMSRP